MIYIQLFLPEKCFLAEVQSLVSIYLGMCFALDNSAKPRTDTAAGRLEQQVSTREKRKPETTSPNVKSAFTLSTSPDLKGSSPQDWPLESGLQA